MQIRGWEKKSALSVAEVNRWHPLLGDRRKYGGWQVHGQFGFEAVADGLVAGVASAYAFDGYVGPVQVVVDPAHRRKGIGSALLDAVLDAVPEATETRVVRASREAAGMLRQRGFSPGGTDDELYLHDVSQAPEPDSGFLVCSAIPDEHRDRVAELTLQYNEATDMPGFEPFDDVDLLVLGVAEGQVWGVAAGVDACADGWGVSERLLVEKTRRGSGLGVALKQAQCGAGRQRGWQRMLAMATGGGHPASRANARAGGQLVTATWTR